MAKLLFLGLILGFCLLGRRSVKADRFVHGIRELDSIYLTAALDVNHPYQLPITPAGIYESWCRPLLSNAMRRMDIIEDLFADNPVLIMLWRITEMTRINMGNKLCENHQVVKIVAKFNRMVNRIIPRLMPWNKMAINTYLEVADPDSQADAGDLICIMKKIGLHLLALVPPRLRTGIIESYKNMQDQQSQLAVKVLRYMNVDLNNYVCELVPHYVPNPYGIKSQDVATLLAWDRVMRRYSRFL